MSRRSICAVTADRAVAGGTSSAGRTISTTLPSGSRPCAPKRMADRLSCSPTRYGGLISTDYVLSGRPAPDLLVLSATALDDGLPRWQHTLAPLIARIWPTLAVKNAWGPDVLSRDPEVGRRARLDPGSPEQMTTRMGAFGFAAQERVRATLATLAVPTLVFHGSDDRLVPPTATEPFEGLPGVTRRVYPGLRHETLNEPEGPQVVADVIAWLREAVDRRARTARALRRPTLRKGFRAGVLRPRLGRACERPACRGSERRGFRRSCGSGTAARRFVGWSGPRQSAPARRPRAPSAGPTLRGVTGARGRPPGPGGRGPPPDAAAAEHQAR